MAAALALAGRGRGRTAPNPNVGCVLVKDGRVVGRGWTQPGGRPHAEAMALAAAGGQAKGAIAYVTLEPCAHASPRGPACADLLVEAGVVRIIAALEDPDPRTAGRGFARLRGAGIAVERGIAADAARAAMAGFLTRQALGRPFVTLKLATSLDGRIALADGSSRWITGPESRAHAHGERSRHEAILVGRGTYEADAPRLDVRLPGLEDRSPRRVVLTRGAAADRRSSSPPHAGAPRHSSPLRHPSESWDLPEEGVRPERKDPRLCRGDEQGAGADGDWQPIASPAAIADLAGVDHLLVEGGARAAAAFLAADLVDRLLLYRAPILLGGGVAAVGDIGLPDLAAAHGRWRLDDARTLGSDRLEVYGRR